MNKKLSDLEEILSEKEDLTEEDVRYVQFNISRKFNAGYRESEVDDFLNKVEHTIELLRKKLKACTAVIRQGRLNTNANPVQPSVSTQNNNMINSMANNPLIKQQSSNIALQSDTRSKGIDIQGRNNQALQEANITEKAAQILTMAQQTAERFVSDAKAQANSIMLDAKNKAEYMQLNTRNKMAAMQREASDKQVSIINKFNTEKLKLENQIKTLKKFESYYREYLKNFLNDQKKKLDSDSIGSTPLDSMSLPKSNFSSEIASTNNNMLPDKDTNYTVRSDSRSDKFIDNDKDTDENTDENNFEMLYQKDDSYRSLPKLKRVPIFSENNKD